MKRPKDRLFAGIDLHGNNLVIGVIDQDGRRVTHRKLDCELDQVEAFLRPHKSQLQSAAVESTFNWYWLVDGMRVRGYSIDLANPAQIEQYSGIKHADDKHDAFFLAELQRLNILPKAHIYDAEVRPVRDLLRRRTNLVHQRTALILSFKSLYHRTTGQEIALGQVKQMGPKEAPALYEHPANQLIAGMQIKHIEQLTESIAKIEKGVLGAARELPYYAKLTSLPGVGKILGMTITLEVGDIKRFVDAGHFASYCRTVEAKCTSNSKKKGANNSKCGNKYLSWAFVEAANFARRSDEQCRRWYERKAAKTSRVLATKALACKLAKAAWHVMADDVDYDAQRVFPAINLESRSEPEKGVGRNQRD